jgi:hypothetical protein
MLLVSSEIEVTFLEQLLFHLTLLPFRTDVKPGTSGACL